MKSHMQGAVLAAAVIAGLMFTRSCDHPTGPGGSSTDTIPTIRQGVYGYVYFWEGDFMPTYPPASHAGQITPLERVIVVHPPTRFDAVKQVDYSPFYSWLQTPAISETRSNASGFFQIALPAGEYSLFVVENSLFYANGTDEQGYLWPVSVVKDSLTFVKLNLTYRATF